MFVYDTQKTQAFAVNDAKLGGETNLKAFEFETFMSSCREEDAFHFVPYTYDFRLDMAYK